MIDRHRRTQSERTAETTERLLEATMSALADLGYQGASTSEIARRAGVSRGAMLHHYPSRAALLASAAEWMAEREIESFRNAMDAIGGTDNRVVAAIDLLWRICSSPAHLAWIELSVGARHEPELSATMAAAATHIRDRIRQTWRDTFPGADQRPLGDVAPYFAFSLLEGLALSQITAPDAELAERVVDALRQASLLLDPDTSR